MLQSSLIQTFRKTGQRGTGIMHTMKCHEHISVAPLLVRSLLRSSSSYSRPASSTLALRQFVDHHRNNNQRMHLRLPVSASGASYTRCIRSFGKSCNYAPVTNLCWNLHPTLSTMVSHQQRHMSYINRGPIKEKKNDNADHLFYQNIGPIPLAVGGAVLVGTAAYFGLPFMKVSRSTYDDDALEELEEHLAHVWRDIVKEEHLEDGALASGQANLTEKVSKFIKNVLSTQEVADTLADLLARVLESKRFQDAAQKLVMALWGDLVADPETLAGIIKLLQKAIENEQIQASVQKLVLALIQDKKVYEELTKLLVSLGSEQRVLDATQDLLTESAHNALNDKEILSHSMEFATKLVGDEGIQRSTGEAIRNTVTYAVKPGLSAFLYAMGVGLIMIGVMALVNSRASEKEMEIVDRAMTTVGGNMHSAAKEGFSFPFLLIQNAARSVLRSIAHAGGSLITALSTVILKVLKIPLDLSRRVTLTVSTLTLAAVRTIFAAISESVIGKAAKGMWVTITTVVTVVVTGTIDFASWISGLSQFTITLVSRWSTVVSQSTERTVSLLFISISNVAAFISSALRGFLPEMASVVMPSWIYTEMLISNVTGRASVCFTICTTRLASLFNSASDSASIAFAFLSSSIFSAWCHASGEMLVTRSKFVVLFDSFSSGVGATLDKASKSASIHASKVVESVSVSFEILSSWFLNLIHGHGFSGSTSTL